MSIRYVFLPFRGKFDFALVNDTTIIITNPDEVVSGCNRIVIISGGYLTAKNDFVIAAHGDVEILSGAEFISQTTQSETNATITIDNGYLRLIDGLNILSGGQVFPTDDGELIAA